VEERLCPAIPAFDYLVGLLQVGGLCGRFRSHRPINVRVCYRLKQEGRRYMQINLTGHHVDITESLRSYVDTKFSKLERHFDHISNVHVILNVEKLNQKAEATMHLSGAEVFASSQDPDMYAAIDSMIDKLDRQVIRHKEKLKKH
jgi:putative sigma-54 modulation protein